MYQIVLMLPAGRIADLIGRRKVYLAGIGLFCIAALLTLLINSVEARWLFALSKGSVVL